MGQLTRVGITGQSGFMGTHLHNFLGTKLEKIERIDFQDNYFNDEVDLQNFVKSCDVIVHIAAMNRHEDEQVLYNTNVGLVHKLINACEVTTSTPKIIFSSSTQEENDSLYGKSKRDGRKYFEAWATNNNGYITSLIIPNVFGPFGKPFYNSFIATFSYQIVVGEKPKLINDSNVNLIYIDELSEVFYDEIIAKCNKAIKSYIVPHTSSRKVSEILDLFKKFKAQYLDNGKVPKLHLKSFELNLFNTFRSFIPKDYFPRKLKKNSDSRGSFVEIIRSESAGQTSYSTTFPGITRGNHYHTRKIERFAIISGKALIQIRKINSNKVYEYVIDGEEPTYIDMPIWYTHNIKNIGNTELLTLFWINVPYDPEDADTYFIMFN